ncbi:MAG: hypothetical protein LBS35_04665 [Synergistaceae bacterium]|nr:hypothetical protein [Synergistaceae bacterium]
MNTLDVLRTAEQLKNQIDALTADWLANDKSREQKFSALKQERAQRESEIWAVRDEAVNSLERAVNRKISQLGGEYDKLAAIGSQCRYKRFYGHFPARAGTAKRPDFARVQKIIQEIDKVGIMTSLARAFHVGTKPRDKLVEEFYMVMDEARAYYDSEIAAVKKSGDDALLQIQQNAVVEMASLEQVILQRTRVISAEYKAVQDELANRASTLIDGSLPEKLSNELMILTQTTLINAAAGGSFLNGSAHAQKWLDVLLGEIVFDMSAPKAILSVIATAIESLTGDGKLLIPLSVEKGQAGHLVFEFEPSTMEKITDGILAFILRLLVYHPPRGVRFSIIDPLGQVGSVGPFASFFRAEEKIMGEKVLHDSREIGTELARLDNMINERIRILSGGFRDITDYNAQYPGDYRHYHHVVIFDYPEEISRQSTIILDRIVKNGCRAGVSVILIASAQSLEPDKNAGGHAYAELIARNAPKFTCVRSDEAGMSLVLEGKKYTFIFGSASNDASAAVIDSLCGNFEKESAQNNKRVQDNGPSKFLPDDQDLLI